MSERKPISAEQFKNKATRLIDIDGFEAGEVFSIRIKPVSLLAMMSNGRIPNELKSVIVTLFNTNGKNTKQIKMNEMEEIILMKQLMDKVCEDCMVEPKYEEVAEYLTDQQKTQIFMATQGNIKDYIPSDEK